MYHLNITMIQVDTILENRLCRPNLLRYDEMITILSQA